MADMVENQAGQPTIRDAEDRPQSHTSRFTSNNQAIDLTDDDRIDSPSEAAMPLISRLAAAPTAAGPSQMNNSQQAETSSAKLEPTFQFRAGSNPGTNNPNTIPGTSTGPLPSILHSALPTAPILISSESPEGNRPSNVSGPTTGPEAPIFPATPGYNPQGHTFLRLDGQLLLSAVPRVSPSIGALMSEIDFRKKRACGFMDDCTITKGMAFEKINWRKSMSHIFGRNKNCTRSIPDDVWIWVCRKHYQRARYRNDHDYNIKINRVVELQVLRLEAWSNYNKDTGMPENGVVMDWSLVVRRRQQLLMDEEEGRKRKSSTEDQDEPDEEDDDDDDDSEPGTGVPISTTPVLDPGAVPAWLLAQVGTGKSTAEIQRIVARIYQDLQQNVLNHFPDIELLPNIVGERVRPKQNRAKPGSGPAARKNAAAGRNIQQSKRQRGNDEERRAEPASQGGRHQFGPGPLGAPTPVGLAHPAAHPLGPSGGHTPTPRGPPTTPAAEPQNGYWSEGYDARRQQQAQLHAQSGYGQPGGYYPGSGGHQQGLPQVSAAKHSRNLSSPMRPTPIMGGLGGMGGGMGGMGGVGGGERPQEVMRAPADRAPDNMYGAPANRADNMYDAAAPAQPQYHFFAPSAPGPSLSRAANAGTAHLPVRGGRPSPPAPGYPAPGQDDYGNLFLPPPPASRRSLCERDMGCYLLKLRRDQLGGG
ncbi:hypothetical protein B0I37DRAFT_438177 [Chaetomium sp. MPI-CAGE-AT-0009]|nr:hypothetical protein B0I37DRAFT_438177 [Chaetomium sp. MPI-CAGE-AT-0009]